MLNIGLVMRCFIGWLSHLRFRSSFSSLEEFGLVKEVILMPKLIFGNLICLMSLMPSWIDF
jgi:hypothetical protein